MASPTLTRPARGSHGPDATSRNDRTGGTAGGPIDHSGARGRRVRTQLRAQWLVLGAALTVLAGVLVAWGIDRAADRVDVVSVARSVAAGAVIERDDLTTTAIAFDTPVTGLAPATSLDALVGRVATVDLQPGVLLTSGMWADGTELSAGERTVGALLDAGTFPNGLAQGSTALAIALTGDATTGEGSSADGTTDPSAGGVVVRVLDADIDERGALSITLAVPEADASRIAQLAALDRLVLVGVPAVDTTADDAAAIDTSDDADVTDQGGEASQDDANAGALRIDGDATSDEADVKGQDTEASQDDPNAGAAHFDRDGTGVVANPVDEVAS